MHNLSPNEYTHGKNINKNISKGKDDIENG